MTMTPDFYLSTEMEYSGLASPRACYVEARVSDRLRDDHLLIQIDPPLIGQSFGLGSSDIDELLISPRFEGSTLCPIKEWPAHVYVARIFDESVRVTKTVKSGQVQVIAWGLLFRTLEEAKAASERKVD